VKRNTIILLLVIALGVFLFVYSAQPMAAPLPSPEVIIHTHTPKITATSTSTVTPTTTPTITPTPPHPLTIEYLRGREYDGGEIVIEEVLEPGSNYARYYVSYQSDGLTIYALMTVPEGEKPETGWPVIVFNHGYIPPEFYRTTGRYVSHVDYFAKQGYIVFRSDYRGHDRSEGTARGAYGSPDYVVDILNAVAVLKQHPDVDPARIGMWGHSMGGYITLRVMVAEADIKAGVIWAGVVATYEDLITIWWQRGSGATAMPKPGDWITSLEDTYGTFDENPAFWTSLSANSFLEDLSGPVQLHHGTADSSVPLEFTTTLSLQIQEAGGVVEYYEYPEGNHNISNFFSMAMLRSIQFFDNYLKGN